MAGVKHLFMDMGYGETLESGPLFAKISITASLVLMVLAGFGFGNKFIELRPQRRGGLDCSTLQRLILAAYTIVMVVWLVVNGMELTFAQWQGFIGKHG